MQSIGVRRVFLVAVVVLFCVAVPGIACSDDPDCEGYDTAVGCGTVRCSPVSHLCEAVAIADGVACVPAAGDGQPCATAQTGLCAAGTCIVTPDADARLACTPDPGCGTANCTPDGTCSVLSGAALACTVELPNCSDAVTAVCDGRGQCAWLPAARCSDGNPCTWDHCVEATGACANPMDPTACTGLAVAALIILPLLAILIVSSLASIAYYTASQEEEGELKSR